MSDEKKLKLVPTQEIPTLVMPEGEFIVRDPTTTACAECQYYLYGDETKEPYSRGKGPLNYNLCTIDLETHWTINIITGEKMHGTCMTKRNMDNNLEVCESFKKQEKKEKS